MIPLLAAFFLLLLAAWIGWDIARERHRKGSSSRARCSALEVEVLERQLDTKIGKLGHESGALPRANSLEPLRDEDTRCMAKVKEKMEELERAVRERETGRNPVGGA